MFTASMLEGGLKVNAITGCAAALFGLAFGGGIVLNIQQLHPFGATILFTIPVACFSIGCWLMEDADMRLKALRKLVSRHASR